MTDKQAEKEQSFTGSTENYSRGENPNSRANLKHWKKGESGNPSGRSTKYQKVGKTLNKVLDEPFNYIYENDGISRRERILSRFVEKAEDGSLSHFQFLAELGCFDRDDE